MKIFLAFITSIFFVADHAFAEVKPQPNPTHAGVAQQRAVHELKPEYLQNLRLNEAQLLALEKFSPDFRLWQIADYPPEVKYYEFGPQQLPYEVRGNLTGSGDITVIAGHDEKNKWVLALLPDASGFVVEPLYMAVRDEHPAKPDVLYLLKKGTILKDGDGPETKLANDSIFRLSDDYYAMSMKTDAGTLYRYGEKFARIYPDEARTAIKNAPFKAEYERSLSLSPEMEKALYSYVPGFKFWTPADYPADKLAGYQYSAKSLPYIIKGDFTGDGKEDIVVSGHDNNANRILLLRATNGGYKVYDVKDLVPLRKENCYAGNRKAGHPIPYHPSAILYYAPQNLPYEWLVSEPVKHMGTESFALQFIATCITRKYPQNDDMLIPAEIIYGPWQFADYGSIHIAHIKDFFKDDLYIGGSDFLQDKRTN